MKRIFFFFLTATGLLLIGACTKNFQAHNTDQNSATEQQLEQDYLNVNGYITQMEQEIVPVRHNGTNDLNQYQLIYNLCGDNFSGQQGASDDYGGNQNTNTYNMSAKTSWYGALFSNSYLNEMTPSALIKIRAGATSPQSVAVAQILKVMAMHLATDAYGPIPYSKFSIGALTVAYDSQESVYHSFFNELDSAIGLLKDYVSSHPGQAPLANIDLIYKSDFSKWIKLANSLKLRLAMRIVYADPGFAKTQAEAAIQGGVMTDNSDNALMRVDGNTLWNPLQQTCYSYNDTRMGATMESFLKGYNDPRASLLFNKVSVPAGSDPDYHGVRTGINVITASYREFSPMNIQVSTPVQLMAAAEVYFLRAEGALRGWNMGGKAQQLYESGVQAAFSQPIGGNNQAAGNASAYLANDTSMPAPYTDPITSSYNIPAGSSSLSTITIKWDAAADFETNLERIITQKWIALFPQGLEAWAEFRRTGYPKVFPVAVNNSGGAISTATQIRRLPFPALEYQRNNAEVTQAASLLGGPDNGGTKLWWDKNPNH